MSRRVFQVPIDIEKLSPAKQKIYLENIEKLKGKENERPSETVKERHNSWQDTNR